MLHKALKWGTGVVGLLLVLFFLFLYFAISTMDIVQLTHCSANTGSIRIPAPLCEYYMINFRGNEEDMKELAIGGLSPILNIAGGLSNTRDKDKVYEFAEFFILKGLDVNGINHYAPSRTTPDLTPLHASVYDNEVRQARFLLKHGADLNIRSKYKDNMTPLEFAQFWQKKFPDKDMSELIRVLSGDEK